MVEIPPEVEQVVVAERRIAVPRTGHVMVTWAGRREPTLSLLVGHAPPAGRQAELMWTAAGLLQADVAVLGARPGHLAGDGITGVRQRQMYVLGPAVLAQAERRAGISEQARLALGREPHLG